MEPDETTDPPNPDDTWWVTYEEDVGPERLTLFYDALNNIRLNESGMNRDIISTTQELRVRIENGSYRQNPKRAGDCYGSALDDARQHGLAYVLGTIVDPASGRAMYHAWSRDDRGNVLEPVAETWFTGDLFEHLYNARPLVEEDPVEVTIKMVKNRGAVGPALFGLPKTPLTESVIGPARIDRAIKLVSQNHYGFGGNCAIFAVVLNRVLGGTGTYLCADSGDHYEYVDHVALSIGGHLFDASGLISMDEFVDWARDEDEGEGEILGVDDDSVLGLVDSTGGGITSSLDAESLERDLRRALGGQR